MITNKKSVSRLLCVVLAFMLLFSVAFIVTEAGHSCVGDGCAVCRQLAACGKVLAGGGTVQAAHFAALLAVFCTLSAFGEVNFKNADTLISLKVKLSD